MNNELLKKTLFLGPTTERCFEYATIHDAGAGPLESLTPKMFIYRSWERSPQALECRVHDHVSLRLYLEKTLKSVELGPLSYLSKKPADYLATFDVLLELIDILEESGEQLFPEWGYSPELIQDIETIQKAFIEYSEAEGYMLYGSIARTIADFSIDFLLEPYSSVLLDPFEIDTVSFYPGSAEKKTDNINCVLTSNETNHPFPGGSANFFVS